MIPPIIYERVASVVEQSGRDPIKVVIRVHYIQGVDYYNVSVVSDYTEFKKVTVGGEERYVQEATCSTVIFTETGEPIEPMRVETIWP